MDLIVGQQTSLYFLRKATYDLKFGVYSLFKAHVLVGRIWAVGSPGLARDGGDWFVGL